MTTIVIRGYAIEVQAKAGTQLEFVRAQMAGRPDSWLAKHGIKVTPASGPVLSEDTINDLLEFLLVSEDIRIEDIVEVCERC